MTVRCYEGEQINIEGELYGLSASKSTCAPAEGDICVIPSHSHGSLVKEVPLLVKILNVQNGNASSIHLQGLPVYFSVPVQTVDVQSEPFPKSKHNAGKVVLFDIYIYCVMTWHKA